MGLLAASGTAVLAQAQQPAALPTDVVAIRDRWAEVNYQLPKAQRAAAFEALAKQAQGSRSAHPRDASTLIWEGIVLSSWAGEKGGLGALGLVKRARSDFEQAIAIDPAALEGSAYTSLGALYYQVPGWPLGFGDDDKAREMLLKGLAINPDGIDANYFYGDFQRDQEQWQAAEKALQKALAAPPRAGRQVADSGRRKEIEAKLAEVRHHLASD
ncbi:hypothetical protein ABB29_12470 [Pseudoxanthomonas dokdonensis]|uniref:Uncharacterized protein n=1 Tax=Pseudoxanthomonas dokdonensis TaxID=344882 RepID=A0A0R0CGU5_9GAMM|nr:hypothetical protein ABB29_12470 [Pseudoxanthomonas dokdonensis]